MALYGRMPARWVEYNFVQPKTRKWFYYLTMEMKETPLLCLINGGYDLITDEFYMEKTYHFKVKTYHQAKIRNFSRSSILEPRSCSSKGKAAAWSLFSSSGVPCLLSSSSFGYQKGGEENPIQFPANDLTAKNSVSIWIGSWTLSSRRRHHVCFSKRPTTFLR